MKLLAIESSTEFLSLALQTEAGLISFHEATGPAASQRILPEIQRLLAKAGAKLAEPTATTSVTLTFGLQSFDL